MVRDAYANYVVQTTLDVVPESEEKTLLLEELLSHSDDLVSAKTALLGCRLRNLTYFPSTAFSVTSHSPSTLSQN